MDTVLGLAGVLAICWSIGTTFALTIHVIVNRVIRWHHRKVNQ